MQRKKDGMRTWQKWFLLSDRHSSTTGLQLNVFPSLSALASLSIKRVSGIIVDHFLLLLKNSFN